jgi:solute carrier family 6 (neurotransmitter transporter)
MFDWTTHTGYLYLPSWVREIGAMLQLLPILLVPFVAIIQTCRYFLGGSDELYEVKHVLYSFLYFSTL